EGLHGTGLVGGLQLLQLAHERATVTELLPPEVAVPAHFGDHPGRERVHHGHPHTVQTAGDGVPTPAELASGVQDRHHHLHGGASLGGVDRHRDAAAVLDHS